MHELITEFQIGNWTDPQGLTGCTVILCPPGTSGSCEVRGFAPGTRETALLAPEKHVNEVHAILLTGGSAFGLAATDGVMTYLRRQGIGYRTPWASVPIVPAAVIYDLGVGRSDVYPTRGSGYAACIDAATNNNWQARGAIGAGTGATVGKWAGPQYQMKGGLGIANIQLDELNVIAVAVVNAVGDVVIDNGTIIAGARAADGAFLAAADPSARFKAFVRPFNTQASAGTNTTIVVALTNVSLQKTELFRIAQRMHDGIARAIVPSHTSFDGDTTFALSHGTIHAPLDLVAELAVSATAEAIRDAVRERITEKTAAAGIAKPKLNL